MPSPARVSKALKLIAKRRASHDYFFAKLSATEWIRPLADAGLFSAPPPATRDGDTISFPFWPESQFLARIAAQAPEEVAEIMFRLPPTDNVRVHEDLAKAAAELPGPLAARWSEQESKWIKKQDYLYFSLPEALGLLVRHLSEAGEVNAALELAHTLLDVRAGSSSPSRRNVTGRFDKWSYQEVLSSDIPVLVLKAGIPGLVLLCDLLDAALASTYSGNKDYSWIWRAAIESHEQNMETGDVPELLINAVRDNSIALIDHGLNGGDVLGTLDLYSSSIFKRIKIYTLVQRNVQLREWAVPMLLDRGNFLDQAIHHEYWHLLSTMFSTLETKSQEEILRLIEKGPHSKLDSDEEIARKRKRYWQGVRLFGIRESLPEDWAQRYESIVKELGIPEHPDFLSYTSGGWVGPRSPKSVEDFNSMSVGEISTFLRTWQPAGGFGDSDEDGLATTLRRAVSGSPERFASGLGNFRDVGPAYVSALIGGLEEAIKRGDGIAWKHVITYLVWVTGASDKRSKEGAIGVDPRWSWVGKGAASLLALAFSKNAIDFSLRGDVWKVIEAVANDPDPTPRDDEHTSMDAATRSINTARGEALHTAVRYALWVRGELERASASEKAAFGMDSIPEVRNQLERHLDPVLDPSSAVRAVYGQWFPWLSLLDSAWTRKNVRRIFSGEIESLNDAAWDTYIIYCRPYDDAFNLLREQYSKRVDALTLTRESGDDVRTRVSDHLGEHLVAMVGRGILSWSDEDQLLRRFFDRAPERVTAHSIASIGQSLHNSKHDVPNSTLDNFRKFWEHLFRHVAEQGRSRTECLKGFGWWFASGHFETEWALVEAMKVLKTSGWIDPDFVVLEQLAKIAEQYPGHAIAILRAMARSDKRGWTFQASREAVVSVLRTGLANEITTKEAEELVQELGAKGHLEFRDLLPTAFGGAIDG